MRPIERQQVILDLIKEVWAQPDKQDMRFWQLIENCSIYFHTEDLNDAIYNLCNFGRLDAYKYLIWWTRGIDWKSPLVYKKLVDLETSHLQELLKLTNCSSKKEIQIILNSRDNYDWYSS